MRILTGLLVGACLFAAEPLPQFVKVGNQYQLHVDGRPFLVLGGQVNNSSGWPTELESVWKQALAIHANTVEIPVYWEEIEPAPGRFQFANVDAIVRGARQNDLRLVFLWFATWKNGVMDYAPEWVKQDPQRFPRMVDRSGQPVRVLSPHSETTRNADAAAFAALMRHLKEIDGEDQTVIIVQVQNEPGSLYTVRDYSDASNRLFAGPAPDELIRKLGKSPGTWQEVFGSEADEAFAAWHVATYVNAVAEAGKREYALPMSVNVWLKERKEYMRPAENYPSGGAVSNMIDVWKAGAPAIDVIAPDIYVRDYVGYREVCDSYRRPDNPLFIPETGGYGSFVRYMFYALGDYGAVGWAPFGFNVKDLPPQYAQALEALSSNFGLIAPAAEKIAALQASGVLKAAVEEDQLTNIHLTFDRFESVTYFGSLSSSYGGQSAAGTPNKTGRALIGQESPTEFWVMGFDALVTFRPKLGQSGQNAQFLQVEEGHFDNGQWVSERLLNGDQTFFGLRLPARGVILRVQLMTY